MPRIHGPRRWRFRRDAEGHRTYVLVTRVEMDDPLDDPSLVIQTPGLPLPGSTWPPPGVGNGSDPWATCTLEADVTAVVDDEPNRFHDVTNTYTTKSPTRGRCQDFQQEDPLLQEPKIEILFSKINEEVTTDENGRPITNSAWEQIRGPQVEFERAVVGIRIEQNVATFTQAVTLPESLMDHVNDRVLWGNAARRVRLAGGSAQVQYYGSCYKYYARRLEFSLGEQDRDILDEATKMLAGAWNPTTGTYEIATIGGSTADPRNPAHFIKAAGRDGNPCRIVLNGAGVPAEAFAAVNRYFISIDSPNINHALTNTGWWIPVTDLVTVINQNIAEENDAVAWDAGKAYVPGDLVIDYFQVPPAVYVAKQHTQNEAPGVTPAKWTELIVLGGAAVTDKGDYSAATTYFHGDYVRAVGASGAAGSIHVRRYPAGNLLTLGIPALL